LPADSKSPYNRPRYDDYSLEADYSDDYDYLDDDFDQFDDSDFFDDPIPDNERNYSARDLNDNGQRKAAQYSPAPRQDNHADRRDPMPARETSRPAYERSSNWDWDADYDRDRNRNGGSKKLSPVILVIIDVLLIGCSLIVFALFHHVLPREYATVKENNFVPGSAAVPDADIIVSDRPVSSSDAASGSDAATESAIQLPFTEEIIVTDTGYSSPNVAISVSTHEAFGSVYYVQDIHVKSTAAFRTALAEDKYGKSIYEKIPDMAVRNNALCAINGDYYAMHSTKGIVIRNGTVYRGNGSEEDDILVMYTDGTMEIFTKDTYNEDSLLSRNDVWQAWSFGPSLLDKDGKAIEDFDSEIKRANPRTVVGYYEAGHYCFVCVDGRSDASKGMTLAELAKTMESLGCKLAFNLDGGQTSMMLLGDQIVNKPYKGGRKCSDILYICEPDA